MRLDKPRINALTDGELSDDAKEILVPMMKQGRVFNIFRTLANYPALMRRWMVFANHILGKSTLSVREREIVILRIGYLCKSGYEWGQHVLIARHDGMSDEEIRCIQEGPETQGLSQHEKLLLKATDELHADAFICDDTWASLKHTYNDKQMMDLVFSIGQYNLVSMALNCFGVQADKGLPGFDL